MLRTVAHLALSALAAAAVSAPSPAALPRPDGTAPPPAEEPSGASARDVMLRTRTGPLRAIYRPSVRADKGRAVLLVAADGLPAGSLDPLGGALQQRGYAVLQVQNPAMIRPQVRPGGIPIVAPEANGADRFERLTRDLRAAVRFLDAQADADVSTIGAAGVGMGANLIALLGEREPRLRVAAFVRPGWHCDPVQTRRSLSSISRTPALLVAGPGDDRFREEFDRIGSDQFATIEQDGESDDADPTGRYGLPRLDELVEWITRHLPQDAP